MIIGWIKRIIANRRYRKLATAGAGHLWSARLYMLKYNYHLEYWESSPIDGVRMARNWNNTVDILERLQRQRELDARVGMI